MVGLAERDLDQSRRGVPVAEAHGRRRRLEVTSGLRASAARGHRHAGAAPRAAPAGDEDQGLALRLVDREAGVAELQHARVERPARRTLRRRERLFGRLLEPGLAAPFEPMRGQQRRLEQLRVPKARSRGSDSQYGEVRGSLNTTRPTTAFSNSLPPT